MTSAARPPAEDQRQRSGTRRLIGTALGVGGVVLLFLGWYGASGRATIGEQVPYLASGSIPGAALVVAAAVVLAGDASQRAAERTHHLMGELHSLFVEDVPDTSIDDDADAAAGDATAVVAVPSGEHYHRPGCAMVAGKPDVQAIDAATITARRLRPCSVCEPDEAVVGQP